MHHPPVCDNGNRGAGNSQFPAYPFGFGGNNKKTDYGKRNEKDFQDKKNNKTDNAHMNLHNFFN
jgi:hypothetical protein